MWSEKPWSYSNGSKQEGQGTPNFQIWEGMQFFSWFSATLLQPAHMQVEEVQSPNSKKTRILEPMSLSKF
jgi:hypothetical protein